MRFNEEERSIVRDELVKELSDKDNIDVVDAVERAINSNFTFNSHNMSYDLSKLTGLKLTAYSSMDHNGDTDMFYAITDKPKTFTDIRDMVDTLEGRLSPLKVNQDLIKKSKVALSFAEKLKGLIEERMTKRLKALNPSSHFMKNKKNKL